MHVDDLRRAGRYLQEHPPADPPEMDALYRRSSARRRHRAVTAGTVSLLLLVGGVVLAVDAARDRVEISGPSTDPGSDAPASPLDPPIPSDDEPSQTPVEAARDGVHRTLAALDHRSRVSHLVTVETDDGYWTLSRPPETLGRLFEDGVIGDRSGRYGMDWVQVGEYAEILLLDRDGHILRSYPMPSLVPSWIHVDEHAVYAGRVGDGGMPTSSIVRIDRYTHQSTVVFFPHDDHIPLLIPGWQAPPSGARLDEFVRVGADAADTPAASWIGPVSVDLPAIEGLVESVRTSLVDLPEAPHPTVGEPGEPATEFAERFMRNWIGETATAVADGTDGSRTLVSLETATGATVITELHRNGDTFQIVRLVSPGLSVMERDGAYITAPAAGSLTITGYDGALSQPGEVMVRDFRVRAGANGPFHLVESSWLHIELTAEDGTVIRSLGMRGTF